MLQFVSMNIVLCYAMFMKIFLNLSIAQENTSVDIC